MREVELGDAGGCSQVWELRNTVHRTLKEQLVLLRLITVCYWCTMVRKILWEEETPSCLSLLPAEIGLKRNYIMYSSLENCIEFFEGKLERTRSY